MSKLGSHHLNQIFKRVFKDKKFDSCTNMDATLEVLFEGTSGFKPPSGCDYSNTYAFSDRVPIFADATLKEDSELCQSLFDRNGEVAIVADSVMSSLNALHLVTITNKPETVVNWLNSMSFDSIFLHTRNISEQDIIVISKLSSFIENHA